MKYICMFTMAALMSCTSIYAAEQPNLIVILADDQGYGDLGCYGATTFKTPCIDQMAKEGIRFTSFYAAPWCSPSRASLMTGVHFQRLHIVGPLNDPRVGLNPDEITLAEALKQAGYATALIGKWHLGLPETMSPIAQGFDYFSGLPLSQINHGKSQHTDGKNAYYRRQWRTMVPGKPDVVEWDPDDTLFTQRITKESLDFIRANRDKPFILYVAQAMVHKEVVASKNFQGSSNGGVWGDAIQELDWSVGQILKTLKEQGIDEKTMVVYLSDNGPSAQEAGSAGPLSGKKGQTLEGGLRVPCIMRWPGHVPAGRTCDEIASIMDIFPTFAHRLGLSMPTDRVIDGKDIWPLIAGQEGARTPHEAYFYASKNRLEGVRSGPWKLLIVDGKAKLFNLESDIGETTDVGEAHPEVVARLQALMNAAYADMGEKTGQGRNSRPLGSVSPAEGKRIGGLYRGLSGNE